MTEDGRRIALTGATGFIGRAVLAQLLERGLQIRALARRPESIVIDPRVEWHVGDIRDDRMWDRLLPGVDAIIHLASAGVADLRAVSDNVETNLPAFVAMMQSSHRHGVGRVVLAGSCFEYGRTGDRIVDRGLLETDPLCPTNVYAATKAGIASLAGPLSDELGLDTVVLRPFHVYGPGEPAGRLIPSVLRMVHSGAEITTTHCQQVRDLVYLDDVAVAFVVAAQSTRKADERLTVVNIGTGIATPLAEVVHRLAALTGVESKRLRLGAVPYREREMWRLVSDSSRALQLFGWSPKVALDDGLKRLISRDRT